MDPGEMSIKNHPEILRAQSLSTSQVKAQNLNIVSENLSKPCFDMYANFDYLCQC